MTSDVNLFDNNINFSPSLTNRKVNFEKTFSAPCTPMCKPSVIFNQFRGAVQRVPLLRSLPGDAAAAAAAPRSLPVDAAAAAAAPRSLPGDAAAAAAAPQALVAAVEQQLQNQPYLFVIIETKT